MLVENRPHAFVYNQLLREKDHPWVGGVPVEIAVFFKPGKNTIAIGIQQAAFAQIAANSQQA